MIKTKANILIIDDQEDILFSVKMVLKKHFQNVYTLDNPKKVIQVIAETEMDVVLLDMNYRIGFEDGKEGIYLLKEIKAISPNTQIILMTAFGKVETAVEGIKIGAYDYIQKPFNNENLLVLIKSAVGIKRKLVKIQAKSSSEKEYYIGQSPLIEKAYTLANKVSKTDANVMILGENGTGKFVLAKHIHDQSPRKNEAFVPVDLGSLNENIFESELFGSVKGAFTDAKTDTVGRFELAQNGTIFLDEIGNLSLQLQSKLLQVIQNKSVTRLGESIVRPLNVRIITATNLDLKLEVAEKRFREDLFYRINVMEIALPSLRNCKTDILPMAKFILEKLKVRYDKPEIQLSSKASDLIEQHAWFGNVRELENRLERALILCENNVVNPCDLDFDSNFMLASSKEEVKLNAIEKQTIIHILTKHQHNISKAAEELGLSRAALYRRIEKYEI
ncbi:MAG: sigma-54-dependent Fis family transcriptional regulator [Flavobacteriia bacterium]|nr:sigma-54-dependent Fis family transcriptional regulator [Flavobacteriia bacterium]